MSDEYVQRDPSGNPLETDSTCPWCKDTLLLAGHDYPITTVKDGGAQVDFMVCLPCHEGIIKMDEEVWMRRCDELTSGVMPGQAPEALN